jgi:hypothetical protein
MDTGFSDHEIIATSNSDRSDRRKQPLSSFTDGHRDDSLVEFAIHICMIFGYDILRDLVEM